MPGLRHDKRNIGSLPSSRSSGLRCDSFSTLRRNTRLPAAHEALISAAAYLGYHGIMTKSFGPQIRGGESSCRVRLCTHHVHNPGGALHAVVALNWNDYLKFGAEMHVSEDTIFIYDTQTRVEPDAPFDPSRFRVINRRRPTAEEPMDDECMLTAICAIGQCRANSHDHRREPSGFRTPCCACA
jgi:hypothetical protein